ncbi:MAG: putative toxin, partial [Chloroflexota bacterium]
LARDLSMRQNDSNNGERRCFCSQNAETPPDRCNVCEVHTSDISNYRIPDFVNSQLIIDSKAVQVLRIDDQISDFISVAHQSNRPLWIFVRLDTMYTQGTLEQIQATGGGIVKYFVVDGHGYLLALEQSLNNILIAVLIFAGGVMVWQFIVFRRTNSPSDDDYYQHDDVDNAEDSIEETEEFMRRMERLSKKTIKDEDDPKKK